MSDAPGRAISKQDNSLADELLALQMNFMTEGKTTTVSVGFHFAK